MKSLVLILVMSTLFMNGISAAVSGLYCNRSDFYTDNFSSNVSMENGNPSGTKDPVVSVNGQDTIIFDFSTAFCTPSYMQVPVRFNSDELIYSMDFALHFDPGVFTYVSMVNHTSYLTFAASYNSSDSTLRFSSYSFVPIVNNTNIVSIRFSLPVSQIDFGQFDSVYTLLNGDNCSSKAIPSIPPPVIVAGGPTTIFPGDSLALTISPLPGFTYLWSNGETDSLIYATGPGLYTINTFYPNGCNSISSILLSPPDPLPINLLNFDATLNADGVYVYWSTGTEINNNYFKLEHSADGVNWNELVTIEGAGNSTDVKHYSYLDLNPFQSWNYYRLKQVDYDGHFTYSAIISKKVEDVVDEQMELKIYPNPCSKRVVEVEVQNLKESEMMELLVLNSLGEEVYHTDLKLGNTYTGIMKFEINLESGLPGGIYYMVYRNMDEKLVKKLILY